MVSKRCDQIFDVFAERIFAARALRWRENTRHGRVRAAYLIDEILVETLSGFNGHAV